MALYIGIKNLIGKGAAWLRSKWSTIVTQLLATFRYRVAGGSDNALLPERNGRAVIDTIYGNTVKWNQLVQNGDFSDGTTNGWIPRVANILSVNNGVCSLTYKDNTYNNQARTPVNIVEGHYYYVSVDIRRLPSNRFLIAASNAYGDTVNCMNTSLTGVNSLIWKATASRTDIMVYSGFAGVVDSEAFAFTNLKIIDLTAIGIDNLTTVEEVEAWLALNVGAQDYYPYDEGSLVSFKGQGVRTLKNNVEVDRLELDVTKIYGKVNGEGSRVQCYPTGMKSASDVHDTLTVSEAIVRMGALYLGTEQWFVGTNTNYTYRTKSVSNLKDGAEALCVKFDCITSTITSATAINTLSTYPISGFQRLHVKVDTSVYPDAPTFKTAMANVMLVYELATPITYTDLIYSEDGGVTGVPLKELAYKVDKYSTEELLVPASVAGEPTSTAIVADIEYQAK